MDLNLKQKKEQINVKENIKPIRLNNILRFNCKYRNFCMRAMNYINLSYKKKLLIRT